MSQPPEASPAAPSAASSRGSRKVRVGVVISNRMKKTIVVRVDRLVREPLYHRVLRRSTHFKAHDEQNTAQIGDVVRIRETRPLSKDKRWRLVEIVRRGAVTEAVIGSQAAQQASTQEPSS